MNLLKNTEGTRPGSILGIRPVHLDIGTNGWQAVVKIVEMLGAERLPCYRLGDEPLVVRTEKATVSPALSQTISALLRSDRTHQLDAATGMRIDT